MAEFLTLPEDGKRYEVLDGDLYVSPSPNAKHQKIVLRLSSLLYTSLEVPGLGSVFTAPFDVVLAEHDIVEPDIMFVRSERAGIIGDDRIEGAPDLLVEVLSKSTKARDRGLKSARYAKAGVAEYWIIDPFRDVLEVYRNQQGTYAQIAVVRSPDAYQSVFGVTLDLKTLLAK